MKNDIEKLQKEFERIKSLGLIKSMRNGNTGVGYTFETLIGKKEDFSRNPDYNSVEIKVKYGYSNMPIRLFSLEGISYEESAAKKCIFDNLSYIYKNSKMFCVEGPVEKVFYRSGMEFKFEFDAGSKKIILYKLNNQSKKPLCFWNFSDLKNIVNKKLKTLAIVTAYPYKQSGDTYYKYTGITFYKLKNFEAFLGCLVNGKIVISIYLKEKIGIDNLPYIDNHGMGFFLERKYIEDLFDKIK